MPRLGPLLLRQARAINTLLPSLLPVCRDLRSAQLELRWLSEHAKQASQNTRHADHLLRTYVAKRAHGEPLQYILGSEYFGNLEIRCRPGVLIPRQETAAFVIHLAALLSRNKVQDGVQGRLRILDLCTGSGCIPLLFHHDFYSDARNEQTALEIVGIDVSATAIGLTRENLRMQTEAHSDQDRSFSTSMRSLAATRFLRADVLRPGTSGDAALPTAIDALRRLHDGGSAPEYDILISNPPYISSKAFRTTTSRSVRLFEPKLALVPCSRSTAPAAQDGDVFYPHLLHLAEQLSTQIVLFEVADMGQAQRVASLAVKQGIWEGVEIWRDEPGAPTGPQESTTVVDGAVVKVRGAGHGRSVFAYRGAGATWTQ